MQIIKNQMDVRKLSYVCRGNIIHYGLSDIERIYMFKLRVSTLFTQTEGNSLFLYVIYNVIFLYFIDVDNT